MKTIKDNEWLRVCLIVNLKSKFYKNRSNIFHVYVHEFYNQLDELISRYNVFLLLL